MDDDDTKVDLLVHVILEATQYAQIKTETKPKVGHPREPVAEQTRFGWTMMSPGKEVDLGNVLLAHTSSVDYENLCRLDVLGLKDTPPGSQENVYEEFQEQLTTSPEGWHQTGLLWKASHHGSYLMQAREKTRVHHHLTSALKRHTATESLVECVGLQPILSCGNCRRSYESIPSSTNCGK